MLRCSRSGMLYKNTQRLGFLQTPQPCLRITLQAFPDKQLPSLRWTYSTIWQTVLRPRASFPGAISHWQKILARATKRQARRQSAQLILLQPSITAETHWLQSPAPTRGPTTQSPCSQGMRGQDASHSLRPAGQRGTGCSPVKNPRRKINICQRKEGQQPPESLF